MRLPDGREHIATIAFPLPLDLLGALSGFTEALAEVGWTDVVILTDGTSRIVARRAGPDPAESPTAPPVAADRWGSRGAETPTGATEAGDG